MVQKVVNLTIWEETCGYIVIFNATLEEKKKRGYIRCDRMVKI